MDVIKEIEMQQMKDKKIPLFNIGDTLSVTTAFLGEAKAKTKTKGKEKEKEERKATRVQTFTGVLIAEKGRGVKRNVTLRRISYGEGVEKVFPVYSPLVTNIKVESRGSVRRSKLYYLRERIGKGATKVKQKTGIQSAQEE